MSRRTLTRDVTFDDCIQFYQTPRRNPLTGRVIDIQGPTYRRLIIDCDSILNRIRPPIDYFGTPRSIHWVAQYLHQQNRNTDMYRTIVELATERYGEIFVNRFIQARDGEMPSLVPFLQENIRDDPAVARRVAETIARAATAAAAAAATATPAATPGEIDQVRAVRVVRRNNPTAAIAATAATAAALPIPVATAAPAATAAALPIPDEPRTVIAPAVDTREPAPRSRSLFQRIHQTFIRTVGFNVHLQNSDMISDAILRRELHPSTCGKYLYQAMNGESIIIDRFIVLPTHPQYRVIIEQCARIIQRSPTHRRIALNYYFMEMERQHPTKHDKSQPSSLARITKESIQTPATDDSTMGEIPMVCNEMFLDITHRSYQPWIRKMKKMCEKKTEKICDQKDLEYLQTLLNKSLIEKPIDYVFGITSISPEKPLVGLWNVQRRLTPERQRYFWRMNHLQHYYFRYLDQEGVGSGVFRSVIMTMMENLKQHGIFVATEENSERMMINDQLKINDLRSLGYRIENETDMVAFYQFIGEFVAFCICHQIPVQIYFAYGFLQQLLYTSEEIRDDEYVFTSLLDWSQNSRSMLNLMKDPATIEYVGMEFNDQFTLVSENKEIDAENLLEFMRLRAKHQYTKYWRPSGVDISSRIDGFCKGFYIRNQLRKAKVSIFELDRLISGYGITLENVEEWVNANVITVPDTTSVTKKIEKWFREILSDKGRTFPMDTVDDSMTREERYLDFIGRLMYFWTSLRKLDFQKRHSIFFNDSGLPTSSTCFYILRLPKDVTRKDELYRRLITAVYNVEVGVGMYG